LHPTGRTLRPMTVRRRQLLPLALLLAGCGANVSGTTRQADAPCEGRAGHSFELSLAINTGGAATPQKAAEAQSGRSGWRVERKGSNGVTLVADRATRHAMQGSDKTWQVDSGTDC
jgi:hypothetical protein